MTPSSFPLRIENQRRIDRALWPVAAFILGLGGQNWYYARLSAYTPCYEAGWQISMWIYMSIPVVVLVGIGIGIGYWLGAR